jgi:rubrerythrin
MKVNRYLEKIASDLSLATKSEGEEEKAIHDYGVREKEVSDPELKKDFARIRKDEKEHEHAFAMIRQKLR